MILQPSSQLFFPPGGVRVGEGRGGGAALPRYLAGGAIDVANVIAAYEPRGAASLAASYVNLANPGTYDLTLGVVPDWWIGEGYYFNSAVQYLKTGIQPKSGWSMFLRYTNAQDNHGWMIGTGNGTGKYFLIGPGLTADKVSYYNGTELAIATKLPAGRLGIAGTKAYRNGVAEAGTMSGTPGDIPNEIYMGGWNTGTQATNWNSHVLVAAYIYNTILTPEQVTALDATLGSTALDVMVYPAGQTNPVDVGANALPAVHTAVDLTSAALYDGLTSFTDIYSAELVSKFDGQEGTLIVRGKSLGFNTGDRDIIIIRADATNILTINVTPNANNIRFFYRAGNVTESDTATPYYPTKWFNAGMSWSLSNNQQIAVYNQATVATNADIGTWAGVPMSTASVIGAATNDPTFAFNGYVKSVILAYGARATAVQMASIHALMDAEALTMTDLNTVFGVGKWSWWQM